MASPTKLDPVYVNSRRETVFVLIAWAVFCTWVVGYCLSTGYDIEPENLTTVMGMPSWIFWGVALPWLMSIVVAMYFGLKFMADDPLEDRPAETSPDQVKPDAEEKQNG